MACVYRHIRLDKNETFYIGIGKTEKRAYSKKNRNKHWLNIIKKTNYEVEILFDDLTWEDACLKEIEFIKIYGRQDLKKGVLVNLTDGGDGTLNVKISDERKINMSVIAMGELNPFYGKKHSEESKNKISQKAIGRKVNNDTKSKISKSLSGDKNYWYGKKLSEEHKNKLSINATGRKVSDDTKEKIKNNSPKRIELYRFIDNQLVFFKSFREASKITGIERRYIKNHFYDLGFMYKNEAINKNLI